MSKRIARRKFYSAVQSYPRGLKFVRVPFKKSQISVRVLHLRIEANRLAVFAGSLFVFPKTDQHNATKITNAGIFRVFALRFGELCKGVVHAIRLQRREAPLKGIFLAQSQGRRSVKRIGKWRISSTDKK